MSMSVSSSYDTNLATNVPPAPTNALTDKDVAESALPITELNQRPANSNTRSIADAVDSGIQLPERSVSRKTIDEEKHAIDSIAHDAITIDIHDDNGVVLTAVTQEQGSLATATSAVDDFFKHLQTVEDTLDKGRAVLKALEDAGFKGDLVTSLRDTADQLKSAIDGIQEKKVALEKLKGDIQDGRIVDVAVGINQLTTDIARMRTDLDDAAEPLKQLFGAAQKELDKLQSCFSSLFSCCFSKKV